MKVFTTGITHFQNNNLQQAEKAFRQCMVLAPLEAAAYTNLGVVLTMRGAHAQAEDVLKRAIALRRDTESLVALARLFETTGRPADAEARYMEILALAPNHAPTLGALANLHRDYCPRPVARASYERAWKADPLNIANGIGYARISLRDDPQVATDVLTQLLKSTRKPAEQIAILLELLVHKEWNERCRRGLPPEHASRMDELFFPFSKTELELFRTLTSAEVGKAPDNVAMMSYKFVAQLCGGDVIAAQNCLRQFNDKSKGHLWEVTTFDPSFYAELEARPEDFLTTGLPPVVSVNNVQLERRPAIYLSCDYAYFTKFGLPLLRSLADKRGLQVHLHIMDASDAELTIVNERCGQLEGLTTAITGEQPGIAKKGIVAARGYYHAVRFIRLYQHLQQHQIPLWLMDVDVLLRNQPQALFASMDDCEAAFRVRPGRLEAWNQFNACVVGVSPAMTTGYLRLVAAYIAHFHQRQQLHWGIDQLALFGAYTYLKGKGRAPAVALLDKLAVDYTYEDDGIVWCNSGKNKFTQAQSASLEDSKKQDPDRAKYIELFAKYAAETA